MLKKPGHYLWEVFVWGFSFVTGLWFIGFLWRKVRVRMRHQQKKTGTFVPALGVLVLNIFGKQLPKKGVSPMAMPEARNPQVEDPAPMPDGNPRKPVEAKVVNTQAPTHDDLEATAQEQAKKINQERRKKRKMKKRWLKVSNSIPLLLMIGILVFGVWLAFHLYGKNHHSEVVNNSTSIPNLKVAATQPTTQVATSQPSKSQTVLLGGVVTLSPESVDALAGKTSKLVLKGTGEQAAESQKHIDAKFDQVGNQLNGLPEKTRDAVLEAEAHDGLRGPPLRNSLFPQGERRKLTAIQVTGEEPEFVDFVSAVWSLAPEKDAYVSGDTYRGPVGYIDSHGNYCHRYCVTFTFTSETPPNPNVGKNTNVAGSQPSVPTSQAVVEVTPSGNSPATNQSASVPNPAALVQQPAPDATQPAIIVTEANPLSQAAQPSLREERAHKIAATLGLPAEAVEVRENPGTDGYWYLYFQLNGQDRYHLSTIPPGVRVFASGSPHASYTLYFFIGATEPTKVRGVMNYQASPHRFPELETQP